VVAALTFSGDAVDLGMGQTSIADDIGSIQAIVAEAILVTGPLTGGSLNPARTFGPLLGGAAAAFAFDAVARPRLVELEAAQGTQGVIEGQRDRPLEAPAATTTQREERHG
jgi:hypothetical protein